ncbi:MAG: putative phosphoribosyl transferase [Chlamydiae bacterium]|nr:putative phosphoribosyl transferase [Chlamydiota bacterium]
MEREIEIGEEKLKGTLFEVDGARGLVIFVHGSGSSRFSPRNQYVAGVLQKGGISTLLFDLLTLEEEQVEGIQFDIPMLAERTVRVIDSIKHDKVGLFGASTGAAAALIAASKRDIAAVVSRGGRPDLALPVLDRVKAPTLLLVGGLDGPVIEMNQEALEALKCEKKLSIIAGATHLFEEEGKLEEVAEEACDWFKRHL